MIARDSFSLKNFLYLIAALTVTLVATGVAMHQVSRNSEWVAHTLEVRSEIGELISTLQSAELGQRGYLITLEEDYLAPYEAARMSFAAEVETLGEKVADNPPQADRLRAVGELATHRFYELERSVTAARKGRVSDAVALVKQDAGKVAMDRIRGHIDSMIAEENRLLAERKARYDFWRVGIAVLIGLAGLLMIVSLYRLFHEVQPMFRELEHTKETLRRTVINLSETVDNLKKANQQLREEGKRQTDLADSLAAPSRRRPN